jgi:hypothetical protein
MTRIILFLVVGLLLAVPGPGGGSPVQGKHSFGEPQRIPKGARVRFEKEFRGGERACVIVRGDHKPVVDLSVAIYDQNGNLIAKDDAGGDFVAAIWYPPRDATYRVDIVNPGAEYNDCYISLK